MTEDIEDFEAMRALVKATIGRLMNLQFDLECGTKEQALKNAKAYVKLTRDGLKAIDEQRHARSAERARKALT